ncbi:DNA topoisomerase IV subunit A [Mycoplasmopsis felis]|uniref:DNA topoisomerase IV subunit A n=1 Tax=Mycoplasmopsis felis TaxID=33923 RepID=UPI002AFF37A7|nr:DNA topoisomerase IV subunit A [Mycoplasmopsis felis]WQQ03018.1 DNA topoisomerase IV subunit A [Mycoplasmopsis felis]
MDKNFENQRKIEKIINESLDKIMLERFGRYAKYVIQQRALPDIRDGLKPVQRRILYSMYDLGLEYDKPYKKSARVVGDVIGKYHPHGDSSVYEAMVNLSQWWKSNIPLLDMHGNIGSIDNDPAAAMRYTEVRMSRVCQYILGELKKNTVVFVPNFDDSEKEPTVLPSIFPTLLVNGAMGIAVGIATDLPPHNLGEIIDGTIAKIKKPNLSNTELNKYIKGPDFPTGGIIKGTKGIIEAFEFGNNSKERIHLYSKCFLYTKGNQKFIEITEIPYGISKSSLVYEIDLLINEGKLDGVLEIKDQSDRNGIKIVITMNNSVNENSILSYLYQKTKLKITYSYNNTVIKNNQPKLLNLNQMISSYVEHVRDIKTKTIIFDLEKNKLRLEIVLGFIKVSEITDEVIRIIRQSTESKAGVIRDLMKHFDFSQIQSTAIAELRLYRLSKTDKEAYLKEKEELEKEIQRLEELLINPNKFNQYIINQLEEIKKLFCSPRKTLIEETEFEFNHKETDLIKEEEVYISFTKNGYIKRFNEKTFESNNLTNYRFKECDELLGIAKMNTMNYLLVFTSFGNYSIIQVHKLTENKWKDLGTYYKDLYDFKSEEKIISFIEIKDFNKDLFIVIGTKNGYFKRIKLADLWVQRLNKSYSFMQLTDNDIVIGVYLSNNQNNIVILTEQGLITNYSELDINLYGTKAKGIKGIYLSLNDKVKSFTINSKNKDLLFICDNKQIIKVKQSKIPQITKNIKGKKINELKEYKVISDLYTLNKNNSYFIYNNEINLNNNLYDLITKEEKLPYTKIKSISFNKIQKEFELNPLTDFDVKIIKEHNKSFEDVQANLKEKEDNIDELLKKLDKLLGKN